jgi:predicted transcriptional regulator
MKQTTLRLPDDLLDALSAEAVAKDRSLNWVIQSKLTGEVSATGKRKHVGPKAKVTAGSTDRAASSDMDHSSAAGDTRPTFFKGGKQ